MTGVAGTGQQMEQEINALQDILDELATRVNADEKYVIEHVTSRLEVVRGTLNKLVRIGEL